MASGSLITRYGFIFAVPLLGLLLALGHALLVAPEMDSNAGMVELLPTPLPVAAFELQTAQGERFTAADLQGQWTLVFSGYTNCPDVCPATLSILTAVQRQLLPTLGERTPRLLFVSIDPARDVDAVLATYTEYFSPPPLAATGARDALVAFTTAFGFLMPGVGGMFGEGGEVGHSSMAVLVDRQGRIHSRIRAPLEVEGLVLALLNLS